MQTLLALGLLFGGMNYSTATPWWAAEMNDCKHTCYVKYQSCRAKCHGPTERECQNKCADEYHTCEAKCG